MEGGYEDVLRIFVENNVDFNVDNRIFYFILYGFSSDNDCVYLVI